MKIMQPSYYDNEYEFKLKENKEIEKIIKLDEVYERSLNFLNVEIAHKILSLTEPVKFIVVDEILTKEEENSCIKLDIDKSIVERLIEIRSLLITITQNQKRPIWKRLLLMKKYINLLEKKVEDNTYYKGFIKVLYRNMEDKRVAIELESLPISIDAKYITLNTLLNLVKDIVPYQTTINIIFEKSKIVQELIKTDHKILEQINREWQRFIKNKEVVFEQYIVFYLFSYLIEEHLQSDLRIEINLMFIYLSIMKYAMQLTWYTNKKQLSQREIEKIIVEFTNILKKEKQIEIELKKLNLINDLNDLACCSILLR